MPKPIIRGINWFAEWFEEWRWILVVILFVAAGVAAPWVAWQARTYWTYTSYDPAADVVCYHQVEAMSCMPRSETALTVEQALELRR